MITHYIVKENIFVAILYRLLAHQKCHVKDCFEINSKQEIEIPKNMNIC